MKPNSKMNLMLAALALLWVTACQAQEDLGSESQPDAEAIQAKGQESLTSSLTNTDVCRHWVFLAPVIHENMQLAKEFMQDNYMANLEESYEINQIHPQSGGYAILRAMLDAADQGKSATELEALALSICRSYPEDAVDNAGGAYEKYIR